MYLSKTDALSAFRVLPLNKKSWPWLVMMAVNPISNKIQFFVDKCLPFGSSISCAHFQRVSNALKHLICYRVGKQDFLTNYLDDFLFLAKLLAECNYLLQQFLIMCELISFPISSEKMVWGTLKLVFLGILLDGEHFTLRVPIEKRVRAQEMLDKLIHKNKATVKELQSLCGFLNFLSWAIFPGRVFTGRMYAKYSDIIKVKDVQKEGSVVPSMKLKGHHHVRLDREFKLDCRVWLEFLGTHSITVVSRPMVDLSEQPIPATELFYYSDASARHDLGYGCVLNNRHWIYGTWEPGFIKEKQPSIEFLELFALCVGIITWEHELSNLRMKVHCDNKSVVAMVNNLTSSCKHCMRLLRILVLNGLQFNRRVAALHVKGAANQMADALLRGQLRCFHQVAPHTMNRYPDRICEKLWPLSKLWEDI